MKPHTFLLAGLASLSLSVPAPAQTGAGTPPLTPNSNTNAPLPQVLRLSGIAQPGTVTTDKPRYRPGQPVQITFRVRNTGAKPITYNFSSGQKFDITVKNAGGVEIWDWAHGMMFTQNLTAVTIPAKKSQSFTATWNGLDRSGRPVSPGVYTLSARLTSSNRPAITGGVIVNNDRDPNNMGMPTKTPADTGAVRQVDVAPPVSATKTILIK